MNLIEKLKDQPKITDSLHNKFKGETCVVAGCSPYLLAQGNEKVKALVEKYYSIAIKQSYDLFPESFNAHVYNCCNFKHYQYPTKKPLVVESSTLPPSTNDFDLYYLVEERRPSHTISAMLELRGDLDFLTYWQLGGRPRTQRALPDGSLSAIHLSPYGPGILSEIIFYLSMHLGFSRVVLIGCDLSQKKGVIHFYRDDSGSPLQEGVVEKNDPHKNAPWINFKDEKELFINSLTYWQEWFKMNNSQLETISTCSPMPDCIPRTTIDELL